jgi:hypothetical protein
MYAGKIACSLACKPPSARALQDAEENQPAEAQSEQKNERIVEKDHTGHVKTFAPDPRRNPAAARLK